MVLLSYLFGRRFQGRKYFVLLTVTAMLVSFLSAFGWVEVPSQIHSGTHISGFAIPLSFPFLVLEIVEPSVFLMDIGRFCVQINFLSIRLGYIQYAPSVYMFLTVGFLVFSSLFLINLIGAIIGYWIKSNSRIERLIKGFDKIKPKEFRQRVGILGYIICLGLLTTLVSFAFRLSESTSEVNYGLFLNPLMTITDSGIRIHLLNFILMMLLYSTVYSMLVFWIPRVKRKDTRERAIVEMMGAISILIIVVEEALLERDVIKSWADLQIVLFFLILAWILLIINIAWTYQHRITKEKEETHISMVDRIDKLIVQRIEENPSITNLRLKTHLQKHGINISLEEIAQRRNKLEYP